MRVVDVQAGSRVSSYNVGIASHLFIRSRLTGRKNSQSKIVQNSRSDKAGNDSVSGRKINDVPSRPANVD